MLKCLNFKQLFTFFAITLHLTAFAFQGEEEVYALIDSKKSNINADIIQITDMFLGRSYGYSGPLGEGSIGIYDQDPLYRTDIFDCTTFVETVMAIALSYDVEQFQQKLTEIRYLNGNISFKNRNHFISLEWLPRNIDKGFINDITLELYGRNADIAETIIDRQSWYQHLQIDRINNKSIDEQELHQQLKELGEEFTPIVSQIPYISIKYLLKRMKYIKRIPEGSIVSIVRPDYNIKNIIGTNLNVTHQGIVVHKNKDVYLRHASTRGKVVEVKLRDYLYQFRNHRTIKGINISQIIR